MNPLMEIQVDFLAGTDIFDAVEQSIALFGLLPMVACVKFQFNGLSVAVNRNSKVTDNLVERLLRSRKNKHWIVEAE